LDLRFEDVELDDVLEKKTRKDCLEMEETLER